MILSRVTRDEVKEKNEENRLKCHYTKTARSNDVYVVCTYLIDYMPAGV